MRIPEFSLTAVLRLLAEGRDLFAENSPFEMKDHLKARGYRWSDGSDGRPKCWWIEIDEPKIDDELHYLRSEIYRYPDADPPTRYLTAFDRFRA